MRCANLEAWPSVARIWEDATCEVHRMVVGPMDNNVYIVRCRRTGDAVLVDAANEHELLLEICRPPRGPQRGGDPRPLGPHPGRPGRARRRHRGGGDGRADAGMLPSYDLILEDDAVLEVGRLRIRTIATPGHTPGSMCFAVEGTPAAALAATPCSPAGPGNTSFEGGDFPTIIRSIEDRLFSPLRRRHHRAARPRRLAPPSGTESPHLQEWIDRGW